MARSTRFARARTSVVGSSTRKRSAFAAAIALFVTPLVGAPSPLPAAAAPAVTAAVGEVTGVTLTEVGTNVLASLGHDTQTKRRGQNGDVAVLGNTAFVGGGALFHGGQASAGRICTDYGGVKIVDVTTPSSPTVTGTITVADTKTVLQGPTGNPRRGQTVNNVAASVSALDAMRHPVNGKDVLAIATQRCEQSFFNGGRIEFWDVTNRLAPTLMRVFDGTGITPPFEWGIWEEVNMFTRNNGPGGSTRVYAMITTPFSVGNSLDLSRNGDFRILDITDIATTVPTQVGSFPQASMGQATNNGCKTFSSGRNAMPTPDGKSAIFSFYDGAQPATSPIEPTGLSGNIDPVDTNDDNLNTAAVFKLDLDNMPVFDQNPSGQLRTWTPTPKSWGFPAAPDGGMTAAGTREGSAADVQPFSATNGDLLTWVSEEDVDPALTNVSITNPPGLYPDTRGCETAVGKKLYELPGQELAGAAVYVGRGCPASALANDTLPVADPYLADPNGKIAVFESGGSAFNGCGVGDKVKRAAAAGATGAMFSMNCCPTANHGQVTPGGEGPIPTIPTVGVSYRSYNKMAGYIPNRVLAVSNFPAAYTRSSSTNVTVRQRALVVTAATNTSPIEITTSVAHLLSTGDRVSIYQVPGNLAANGDWAITVVPPVPPATASTKFTLNASAGNGPSQAGGVVVPCPVGTLTCAAQRSDLSRFKSVADINDAVAGAQINSTLVTIAPPGVTPPAPYPVGTTPIPNVTIPVLPLLGPIAAGVVIRFSNGTQVITAAAAATAATSLVVQSGFPDTIDGPIPAGTTGSAGFDVVAGRSYDAGVDLEVEARTAGTFRAAVQWFDASGTLITDSEIGSLSAVTTRTRFTQAVFAPVGAVRGGIRFEWTGVGAAGTAFADTFALTPTGLAVNLKDHPGRCDGLVSWPPTPGQCGTPEAAWGAQRIINFNPALPTELATYQSPNSKVWPPPTNGIYAPRQARMFGRDIAFTTWMSDGLRVIDVSNPANPVERASYVPAGMSDPTPTAGAGATNRRDGTPIVRGPSWPDAPLIHGVDIIPTGEGTGYAVLSDINAGIKVVRFEVTRQGAPGMYTPLTPARILDTRNATGAPAGKVGAGSTTEMQVTGQGGVPADGVSAVVLNLSTVEATGPSFVTAWPSGQSRPLAANINFPGPSDPFVENLVTVKVGANGRVSLYNHGSQVHLVADVAGWYADEANPVATRYNAITPARIFDTRSGIGAPIAKVGPGATIEAQVTGAGGVPITGVSAVAVNVSAVAPNSFSYLTAYPTGVTRPLAANITYTDGNVAVTNRVVVKLGTNGRVSLYNHAGQTDLVVDVVGWYGIDPAPPGSRFKSLPPTRILDTRNGTGAPLAKVGPAGTLDVQITGVGGVPLTGVTAVVFNLTAIAPSGATFVTAWPTGVTRPTTADLTPAATQTTSNLVIVKVGTGGKVSLYNHGGLVDFDADVAGWFEA